LLHAIGKQVNSVDADQQIQGNVDDLEHWIRKEPEYQQEHLVAWLFGAFAFLGLGLAATGLYSVVSFSVEQRTNEFGIRMALGARRADVFRVVFSSIFTSVGSGFVGGLILTLALNQLLARWAEGSSRDLLVLFSATVLLSVIALLACAAPAHRASTVDPMTALRYE
jgi:ABC-type antimicrobial peptide transport system permease subunit